ncbi:MAG: tetratricopeptide repeat protein [Acidobacteriaceae bacterium]|jgi:tetratricopeptide (TPR) repeat protein
MNRIARLPVMAALLCTVLFLTTGCSRLKARDQLNKGVEAFKTARYEEAINHFQQAVALDPTLPMARLYLATAYSQQVIPNLQTPDNLKNAQLAIQNFQIVLDKEPANINALKGIAALYLNIQNFDQAKAYQNKVIAADPNDAAAYYTIGVIDWTLAYKNALPVRQSFGLHDNGDPIKDQKACQALAEKNGPIIQEGLDALNKATQLKENYDDAMAYINLMYRRKAENECGNEDARKADIATADEWVQKAMAARKANQIKANQNAPKGIVLGK